MPVINSDYIVFVDESGDHGLQSIDPQFPAFVLAFCLFKKSEYLSVIPDLHRLKFEYFGHDSVVFHEREIRKSIGPFSILMDATVRAKFMADVSTLIGAANFKIIASVIDKQKLKARYAYPENPYEIAMGFCMERVAYELGCWTGAPRTHVIAEARGKKEDDALELEFRRIAAGANAAGKVFPLEPVIIPKASNSCGLQIADLCARPIGRHVLDPSQPNQAYSTIEPKIRKSPSGNALGWGLKVFP